MALAGTVEREEQGARPRGEYLRFSLWQRFEHWLLVASFFTLLATGLPQKFDDAAPSVWVINTLGGIDTARFIHRIAATVFVFESVMHVGGIALSMLRRRLGPTMVITLQDFRDAFNMLRYSLGLTRERPRFDRYDYRQKFEYWGIVFGAVIMIASGAALWFPTYVTRLLPGEVIPAAKQMHGGEALLAFLVIVVWHFYDVVLSPAVFPLDLTMITGKISRHRLMDEHPREYARLIGAEALPLPLTAGGQPGAPLRAGAAPFGRAAPPQAVRRRRPAPALPARWFGLARQSLHLRVMILVTVGLTTILAVFSVSSLLAVDESIDRSLDERRALAQVTAGQVDYVLRESIRTLEDATFTEGFDLTDSDTEPEERALRWASASRMFNLVYVMDDRGVVLWTEPLHPWAVKMGLDSQPHVQAALESGRPSISGLSTQITGTAPVVSLVAPVRDRGGQLVGLMAGDIALNGPSLADIIRPAAVGGSGYAQIVDQEGAVLASTKKGQLLEKSDHEGQLANLIQQKQTTSGTCHGCHESAGQEERQTEVMAFAPLESTAWGVVIRQPEEEALAPAQRLRDRALWFGVPAFGLALVFAWVTVRSILRPVRLLTTAAEKIAAGNLAEPVPDLGQDEIGGLAGAFETMRQRLKESVERIQAWGHELEARVRERTRELETSRDHLKTVAEENASLYTELQRKEAARSKLLQKVIGAQEEERRRIARELHDETSQVLNALVVGMDAAALERGRGGRAREKLSELKALAEDALEGVHRLVYDLRPSVLDDLGLVAGLRWYLETRLHPLGVGTDVVVTGEGKRLPMEIETALFRIGQEAISNIARHAQATRVSLSLTFSDDRISMRLEDDGVGFDAAALSGAAGERAGWGILGMQERAALLGGALEVASTPGQGTRVSVSLPLADERR
ncbi:MAG: HAMP domain-containing protein [Chloroflexi bacterium]|nr:HAMP domain-containing protein [Chloroflexota bacterium]